MSEEALAQEPEAVTTPEDEGGAGTVGTPPPPSSEEAAQAELLARRHRRIEAIAEAFIRDPANQQRALAELYVMTEDLYNGFVGVFQQFQRNGGGMGALFKMLR